MIGITIGKAHTVLGNGINVWCRHILASIHTHIPVFQIISQDDDDIGLRRRK